jgi:hypothetical protein
MTCRGRHSRADGFGIVMKIGMLSPDLDLDLDLCRFVGKYWYSAEGGTSNTVMVVL